MSSLALLASLLPPPVPKAEKLEVESQGIEPITLDIVEPSFSVRPVLIFNGASSIQLGSLLDLSPICAHFTIEIWMCPKRGVTEVNTVFMAQSDTTVSCIMIELNQSIGFNTSSAKQLKDRHLFLVRDDDGKTLEAQVDYFLSDDRWHHVLWHVMPSTDDMEIIIDGQNVPIQYGKREQPIGNYSAFEDVMLVASRADRKRFITKHNYIGSLCDFKLWAGKRDRLAAHWPMTDVLSNDIEDVIEGRKGEVMRVNRDYCGMPKTSAWFNGKSACGIITTLGDFGNNLRRFAVEFWMQSTMSDEGYVFNALDDDGSGAAIILHHDIQTATHGLGNVAFKLIDRSGRKLCAQTRYALTDGRWHHVLWRVYDSVSNDMAVFVDNRPITLNFMGQKFSPYEFTEVSDAIGIGQGYCLVDAEGESSTYKSYYCGYLQDFKIWAGECTLLAHWALSDGPGSIVAVDSAHSSLSNSVISLRDGAFNSRYTGGIGSSSGVPRANTVALQSISWSPVTYPPTNLFFNGRSSIVTSSVIEFPLHSCTIEFWMKTDHTLNSNSKPSVAHQLTGHWRLNSNGSDSSGFQRNATVVGSPIWSLGVDLNSKSFGLNETCRAELCPSQDLLTKAHSSMTIAIWFRTATQCPEMIVDEYRKSDIMGYPLLSLFCSDAQPLTLMSLMICADGKRVGVQYRNAESGSAFILAFPCQYFLNQWHHMCATYSEVTEVVTLYYDGQEVASCNAGLIACAREKHAVIGADVEKNIGIGSFKGDVADARVYSDSLGSDQVFEIVQLQEASHDTCIAISINGIDNSSCSIELHTNAERKFDRYCTLFSLRDSKGRCLDIEVHENIYDDRWHRVKWSIIDSKANRIQIVIDGRVAETRGVRCQGPYEFHAGDTAQCVELGARRDQRGTLKRCFKGSLRDVLLATGTGEAARPVCSWPLLEGIGSVVLHDVTGQGCVVNASSTCSWKETERIPVALHFSGTQSFVHLGLLEGFGAQLRSFCLEFWIKATIVEEVMSVFKLIDTIHGQGLFRPVLGVDLNRGLKADDFGHFPGSILFHMSDGNNRVLEGQVTSETKNLFDGEWHYVQWFVIDSSENQMEVRIDNVATPYRLGMHSCPQTFLPWESPAFLGATHLQSEGKTVMVFKGFLKHFKVWQGPPSALELVAHWPLEEGCGQKATDTSGRGNNGVISNGCQWAVDTFPHVVFHFGGPAMPTLLVVPIMRWPRVMFSSVKFAFWLNTNSESRQSACVFRLDSVESTVNTSLALYVNAKLNRERSDLAKWWYDPTKITFILEDMDARQLVVSASHDACVDDQWHYWEISLIDASANNCSIMIDGVNLPLTYVICNSPHAFADFPVDYSLSCGGHYNPKRRVLNPSKLPTANWEVFDSCFLLAKMHDFAIADLDGQYYGKWPLSDGLGATFCADNSGNRNNAEIYATTSCWIPCELPPCVAYFNGQNSFLECPAVKDPELVAKKEVDTTFNSSIDKCKFDFWIKTDNRAFTDELPAPHVHWTFNANTSDVSGNGLHLKLMAAPQWVSGARGLAVRLNGKAWAEGPRSDMILPSHVQDFSISVWFFTNCLANTADNALGMRLITLQNSDLGSEFCTAIALGFYGDGKNIMVMYRTNTGWSTLLYPTVYSDGQWHMMSCTYEGSTRRKQLSLYYDGVLVNSIRVQNLVGRGSCPCFIGSFYANTQVDHLATDKWGLFNGALQNVCVYHTALSAKQIHQIYEVPNVMTLFELVDEQSKSSLTPNCIRMELHRGLSSFGEEVNCTQGTLLMTVQDSDGRLLQATNTYNVCDGKWHHVTMETTPIANEFTLHVDNEFVYLVYGRCESPPLSQYDIRPSLTVGCSKLAATRYGNDSVSKGLGYFFRGAIQRFSCYIGDMVNPLLTWGLNDGFGTKASDAYGCNPAQLVHMSWNCESSPCVERTDYKLVQMKSYIDDCKHDQAKVAQEWVVTPNSVITSSQCISILSSLADGMDEEILQRLFYSLDTSNNGYLLKAEFRCVYQELMEFSGSICKGESIDNSINKFNKLGADKLSYDEFCILMLKVVQR